MAEQPVPGPLARPGARGRQARALSVRTGILKRRDVRQAQVVETGRLELPDDAAADGLGRNA